MLDYKRAAKDLDADEAALKAVANTESNGNGFIIDSQGNKIPKILFLYEVKMKISLNGLNLIKEFEGLELKAYKDSVGVVTIGYGSTGPHVSMGMTITKEQAEQLLKKDLERFEKGVPTLVKVPLNQNQFDALVSFSFNLGLGNLKSSTLLKKLNAKDYQGAANEILRWNRAGGKVLNGLTRRRIAERDLFLS